VTKPWSISSGFSECISPFQSENVMYSNYPSCHSQDKCPRCDDTCAQRNGKKDRYGYIQIVNPRPPSKPVCSYDCKGWPYASCETKYRGSDGIASGTCIPPYYTTYVNNIKQTRIYRNYPDCALNTRLRKCKRCDDYCAVKDGKPNKHSYIE